MSLQARYLLAFLAAMLKIASAQQWSESQLISEFQAQSPQVQVLRASTAVTRADALSKASYSNPYLYYSREGAGYTQFLQLGQVLPVSGRLQSLRKAATDQVAADEAQQDALIWSLRCDLRLSISRMTASQSRLAEFATRSDDVQRLVTILSEREKEGEGSRYDLLRAQREWMEIRSDIELSKAQVADAASRIEKFLPQGSRVATLTAQARNTDTTPSVEALLVRAMQSRGDYRSTQRTQSRYQAEENAARRLAIPEPTLSAGLKRADLTSGVGANPFSEITKSGFAFGITMPIPLFNRGQHDVDRAKAEQQRAAAQLEATQRQIRAEVTGAVQVLSSRNQALTSYRDGLRSGGDDLARITTLAYQEGEVGILELLDAYRVSRLSNLRLIDLQEAVSEAWIELERVVGEEVQP